MGRHTNRDLRKRRRNQKRARTLKRLARHKVRMQRRGAAAAAK